MGIHISVFMTLNTVVERLIKLEFTKVSSEVMSCDFRREDANHRIQGKQPNMVREPTLVSTAIKTTEKR